MIDYTKLISEINVGLLIDEINQSIFPAVLVEGAYFDGSNVFLHTDQALDENQEAALDAVIAAHDPQPLADLKNDLKSKATVYYRNLLSAGYSYGPGETLTTAPDMLGQWSWLKQETGSRSYPYKLPTLEGSFVSIADQAALDALVNNISDQLETLKDDFAIACNNITNAADKAAAQSAHDAYIGP